MGAGGKVTKARERPKVVIIIPAAALTVISTLASREGVTMCIVIVVLVVTGATVIAVLVVTAAIVSIPVVVVTGGIVIAVVIMPTTLMLKLTPGPALTVTILWEYSRDTAANISGAKVSPLLLCRACVSPKVHA